MPLLPLPCRLRELGKDLRRLTREFDRLRSEQQALKLRRCAAALLVAHCSALSELGQLLQGQQHRAERLQSKAEVEMQQQQRRQQQQPEAGVRRAAANDGGGNGGGGSAFQGHLQAALQAHLEPQPDDPGWQLPGLGWSAAGAAAEAREGPYDLAAMDTQAAREGARKYVRECGLAIM